VSPALKSHKTCAVRTFVALWASNGGWREQLTCGTREKQNSF
jgi:hypothetical protein